MISTRQKSRCREVITRMEGIIKKYNMITQDLYIPPNFNDEPRLVRYMGILNEPWSKNGRDIVGAVGIKNISTKIRALGEIIERSCQAYPRKRKLIRARYADIEDDALHPQCFLNKETDIDTRGLEHIWFSWDRGINYRTREPIYLPAQQVFLHYISNVSEPILGDITTNGAALSITFEDAVFSGLCEIIERDAFFLHYLSFKSPPLIDRNSIADDVIHSLILKFQKFKLDLAFYDISIDMPIPVIMAVIVDKTKIGPPINIGTSCKIDYNDAMIHAACEAHQVRLLTRELISRKAESNRFDMNARALYWSEPERLKDIEFLIRGDKIVEVPKNALLKNEIINKFPYDIFVSDLTLPGINNFYIVKVLVPEMFPLYFNENLKSFTSKRLLRHVYNGKINKLPHPFI